MKPTPGIRRRHTTGCPALTKRSARCRCGAGYEASVYDKAAGRKIRRSFPTLAAARTWRSDAESGVRHGTVRAPRTPTTVNEAADALLEGMRSGAVRNRSGKRYKPSVIRSYAISLELHVCPDLGAMKLGDVKRRHVQRIVERLVADELAPSTVRNAVLPLRVIYRRAIRDELVSVNPCVHLDLPASARSRVRIISTEQAAALVAALPEPFDRALWATALYAGLRRGELMALRWRDVDLAAGALRVERAYDPKACEFIDTKYEASDRSVPIAAALRRALLEHRVAFGAFDPDALVFGEKGQPFDDEKARDRAQETWAVAAVGAFLQGRSLALPLEPIVLHEARHTAASVMIAAGVNVKALSEFLGHSSITTTLDRYGHLLPGSIAEAASALDAFLDRSGALSGAHE
jgi:integrase